MPSPLLPLEYREQQARQVAEEPIVGERKTHRGTLEEVMECLNQADSRPQLESALAAINAFTPRDERQQLVIVKCRALIVGYDARWRNAGYVPESVERTLLSDLFNPDTGGKSRSFQIAGKLDVIARLHRRVVIDHKTTSQDIEDPNSAYWRQLVVEGQVDHYMLLQWLHAEKCDDAIWDVIRKPNISPKKITKAEIARVVSLGDYCGAKVSKVDQQTFLSGSDRETLAMYESRLVRDCTEERPDHYFARRSVPRIDAEILEYSREVWQHSQDMLYTRKHDRLPPRNSGACLLYGTPCKFLGICSGHDTPDSDRWQPKQQIHPELPADIGNEKQLLTNSRIRTFQTCRRKHYYEYELAIERQDEDEKEALFFGTVLHAALEAWWRTLLPERNDDNGNESPASGAGNASRQSAMAE